MRGLTAIGRVLLALAGAGLLAIAMSGLFEIWLTDPWAGHSLLVASFGRSISAAIFLIPTGMVASAIWPRLWPLPIAAFLWAVAATAIAEPSRFDFVIERLIG